MVGFPDLDHDGHVLSLELVVLQVVVDLLAGMGVKLAVLGLEVEEGGNIDPLGVNGLGVDAGGVVSQPGPVIVALPDTQFKLLILDFNIKKHQMIMYRSLILSCYVGYCIGH